MSGRVLSIQSHVVHGYVGNKAAVFPLQLLGFDVDFINSVHFSNHTGYKNGLKGSVMDGDQLRTVLGGMEDNDLLEGISYMLTGYIGSSSFCEAVLDVLKTVRKHNSNDASGSKKVIFVCDPVLGDDGKFYVPPELVKVYQESVIPSADAVTPNQFEVEQLTGIKVTSVETAKQACDALHSMGPSIVFMTSAVFPEEEESETTEKQISIIASQKLSESGETKRYRIQCPKIPGSFTGTGDLTASLFLGHFAKNPDNLPLVMEKVINTMYAVIKRTHEAAGTTVKSKELRLIQSKDLIENPPSDFKVQTL